MSSDWKIPFIIFPGAYQRRELVSVEGLQKVVREFNQLGMKVNFFPRELEFPALFIVSQPYNRYYHRSTADSEEDERRFFSTEVDFIGFDDYIPYADGKYLVDFINKDESIPTPTAIIRDSNHWNEYVEACENTHIFNYVNPIMFPALFMRTGQFYDEDSRIAYNGIFLYDFENLTNWDGILR